MSTPALDELFAQGQYTLEIVGFEVRASLKGEGLHPVARTELILVMEPNANFPGAGARNLFVRIVGPEATFDQTADGQIVVGACRITNGEYEVVIMATEVFQFHCLHALSAMPRVRCFLGLTTKTKIEQSVDGYVFVLEATLSAKPQ